MGATLFDTGLTGAGQGGQVEIINLMLDLGATKCAYCRYNHNL